MELVSKEHQLAGIGLEMTQIDWNSFEFVELIIESVYNWLEFVKLLWTRYEVGIKRTLIDRN